MQTFKYLNALNGIGDNLNSFVDMVEARGPRIKSDLEKKLEDEGWTFETNELLSSPYDFREHKKVLSDNELITRYLSIGYSHVLIAEAYDHKGDRMDEFCPHGLGIPVKVKAVYVKGEPNKAI